MRPGSPSTAPTLALAIAIALANLGGACGGEDPPRQFCAPDSGVVPTVVALGEGEECVRGRVSIPTREEVGCRGLPGELSGGRITLRGHPDSDWSVTLERIDGMALQLCVAALDGGCACMLGRCAGPEERYFYLELGAPEGEHVDLVVPPGTYEVNFCSR